MDFTVDLRPINTLQRILDNAQIGDYVTVYQDGDQQIIINREMPKRYLYQPKAQNSRCAVKVPKNQLIMLFDEEDRKAIVLGAQEVYDFIVDCIAYDFQLYCSPQQWDQVIRYLKDLGALII